MDTERAELEAFADAVAGTASYLVPVKDAVHGVAVMDAAIRSAGTDGKRVEVESLSLSTVEGTVFDSSCSSARTGLLRILHRLPDLFDSGLFPFGGFGTQRKRGVSLRDLDQR